MRSWNSINWRVTSYSYLIPFTNHVHKIRLNFQSYQLGRRHNSSTTLSNWMKLTKLVFRSSCTCQHVLVIHMYRAHFMIDLRAHNSNTKYASYFIPFLPHIYFPFRFYCGYYKYLVQRKDNFLLLSSPP